MECFLNKLEIDGLCSINISRFANKKTAMVIKLMYIVWLSGTASVKPQCYFVNAIAPLVLL